VDCDFAVLTQNIITHQTETIQHYQSMLSHDLFCYSKENIKMTALQVSTNQMFLISFAKVKINTASYLLSLDNR